VVSNVQISKRRRQLFVVAALAVALMVGRWTQEQLGIAFNLESLERFRSWVAGLGWLGPSAFVVLVVSRLFIGLSYHVILIVGGLALWGSQRHYVGQHWPNPPGPRALFAGANARYRAGQLASWCGISVCA